MGKITVIFNNVQDNAKFKSGWGSSLLAEHGPESILFDTGPCAESLFFNLDIAGINAKKIRTIVISHWHRDHAGGLEGALRHSPKEITVYLPDTIDDKSLCFIQSFAKSVIVVRKRQEIARGIHSVAMRGLTIREQLLAIEARKGLVVLTGCAHPGIRAIIKEIKQNFGEKIYAVFGGLHLEHYPAFLVGAIGKFLRQAGIEIIGPNHCTGRRAAGTLREIFGEQFLHFPCGAIFEYEDRNEAVLQ
jgi:7,8-dihydropterin-6-yl-methyl-4-(beta-D-ribofuranosyl)aminobenzene 5'-phosphate synthase